MWKLLERFGVLGIQFVLQIILARLLSPELYGVLTLMIVFTQLANIFIQTGFNTALVQNKDVTEEDYSSVFWVTLAVALLLYGILFAAAPAIAAFYHMPDFVWPFRVLCLVLFPGAYNSIQIAKVSRKMDFKKVFYSNVFGILLAGVAGIVIALLGGGLWALVAQNLLNVLLACVVMAFTVKWRPHLILNMSRIKVLFSYGWKLLGSGLLDTLYQNLQSLVIGKKYDSSTLAFYDRGKQFPHYGITAITSSVQSVLLPAMAAEQDDLSKIKRMTRNSVMLSSYVIFPMMAGLAGVAEPLIKLLLTDKWIACVPFMQICCITYAFYPVYTSNLQAIKAIGRSDIFLKLEIIKKIFGIVVLAIAVFCFETPLAIALTGVISIPLDLLINAYPNKKLIDYSFFEQMKDILPSAFVSMLMMLGVLAVGKLNLPIVVLLIIQVILGAALYILLSLVLQLAPFKLLLTRLKQFQIGKRKGA